MRGGAVDLQHGVRILSFIYTRCPDPTMCPLVTLKFGRMVPLLAGTPIGLLEVTLDPAYDTPPVLRRYARRSAPTASAGRLRPASRERSRRLPNAPACSSRDPGRASSPTPRPC